jgi:glycosyltransferase involved in cell wall biosynthesis
VSVAVLHVLEAIEGGVARHMVNLVRHVDADHTVVVPPERVGGTTDTAAFGAMEEAGARIQLMDMRRSPWSPYTVAAVPRLQRLIRRNRPDVVHGHSAIGGAIARFAASRSGCARVYTPHGLYPARSAYAVERALGSLTDRLIAVSPSEAEMVARLRLVPRERVVVIPNAVELENPAPSTIDLRTELGVDLDAPVIGTVARLAPQKAPEVFVRACSRVAAVFPDARFVMVGDGPLLQEVRSEVAASGLDDRLLLLRDRPDGDALMSQFDVFALSSRYEAGAPYAAMEAMRAGTPVVVTDVVGCRDTVEPGRSGYVVPPDDPAALADAVTHLLADARARRRMVDAARARLEARFDVRRFGTALTHLYRSLASETAQTA